MPEECLPAVPELGSRYTSRPQTLWVSLPAGDRYRFARLQEMLQMAVEETKPSIEQRGVTRIEEPPADLEFDPVRRLIRDALGLPSPAIRPEDVAGQQRFAIRRVSWKVVADPSR